MARVFGSVLLTSLFVGLLACASPAAPSAAFLMEARTGAVLLSENADARLHPASLTKMMTLYVAFDALERGRLDPEAPVEVSARAAETGGSALGLRAGERIALRQLVRAVAIRSANDAAVALAEGIAGSETAFVAQMNATARRMGLSQTTFRNAHGLTVSEHLTTARDMSVLGQRLLADFPGYAWLYAQRGAEIGQRRVAHTNRRFLAGYPGADGIKTGYTRAAGYTLTASAVRDGRRLIVTVLGAPSSAARAARAAELLDYGFAQPPGEPAPQASPLLLAGGGGVLLPMVRDTAVPLVARERVPPRGGAPPGGVALHGLRGP